MCTVFYKLGFWHKPTLLRSLVRVIFVGHKGGDCSKPAKGIVIYIFPHETIILYIFLKIFFSLKRTASKNMHIFQSSVTIVLFYYFRYYFVNILLQEPSVALCHVVGLGGTGEWGPNGYELRNMTSRGYNKLLDLWIFAETLLNNEYEYISDLKRNEKKAFWIQIFKDGTLNLLLYV
ncbi:hypothetical protein ACJX0J_039524 [Zea mays]